MLITWCGYTNLHWKIKMNIIRTETPCHLTLFDSNFINLDLKLRSNWNIRSLQNTIEEYIVTTCFLNALYMLIQLWKWWIMNPSCQSRSAQLAIHRKQSRHAKIWLTSRGNPPTKTRFGYLTPWIYVEWSYKIKKQNGGIEI